MWQFRALITTALILADVISARPPITVARRNAHVQVISLERQENSAFPIHLRKRAFPDKQEAVRFPARDHISPATRAMTPRQLYKSHVLAARASGSGEGYDRSKQSKAGKIYNQGPSRPWFPSSGGPIRITSSSLGGSNSVKSSGSGEGYDRSKQSKKGRIYKQAPSRPWLPSSSRGPADALIDKRPLTKSTGGQAGTTTSPRISPTQQSTRDERIQAWLQKKRNSQHSSGGQNGTPAFLGGQTNQQTTRTTSNVVPRPQTILASPRVNSQINKPATSNHPVNHVPSQKLTIFIDDDDSRDFPTHGAPIDPNNNYSWWD